MHSMILKEIKIKSALCCPFPYLLMFLKTDGCVANSIDPDQMLQNAATDVGYIVCCGLCVPIHRANKVKKCFI